MKKFLMVGLIAFGATSVFAQTSATSQLNVVISDLRSIEVMQPTVTIPITNQTELQNAAGSNGVSTLEGAHLKIVSNSGFKVTVSTTSALVNGPKEISQDNVFISISNPVPVVSGVTNELAGYMPVTDHILGTQATIPLIQTQPTNGGTSGTYFDVNYKLAGVTNIASLGSGTFSTMITYSILPL